MQNVKTWQDQKKKWEDIFSFRSKLTQEEGLKLAKSWEDFLCMSQAIITSNPQNSSINFEPLMQEAVEIQSKAATFFNREIPGKPGLPTQKEVDKFLKPVRQWRKRTDVDQWRKIFSQEKIPNEKLWVELANTWPDLVNTISQILSNPSTDPISIKYALQQEILDFLKAASEFFGKDFDKDERIYLQLPGKQFLERTNVYIASLQEWLEEAKEWEEIFKSDKIDSPRWLALIKTWDQFITLTQKLSNLNELKLDNAGTVLFPYQQRANKILEQAKGFFKADKAELTGSEGKGLPLQGNLERISVKQLESWRDKKSHWERIFALDFPTAQTWKTLAQDWELFKGMTQIVSRFQFGPTPVDTTRSALQQEAAQFLKNANIFFNGKQEVESIATLPAEQSLPNFHNIKLLQQWQARKKVWKEIFSLKEVPSESELERLLNSGKEFMKLTQVIASGSNLNLGFNIESLQLEAKQFLDEANYFFKIKPDKDELAISKIFSSPSLLKETFNNRIEELKNWQKQKKQWEAIFSYDLILDEKMWGELMSSWEDFINLTTGMASSVTSLQKEAQDFLVKATNFFNTALEELPQHADLKVFSIEQSNWQVQKKQWERIFDKKPPAARTCYILLAQWDGFVKMTQQEAANSKSQFSKEAEQFLISAATFFKIDIKADLPVSLIVLPNQSELKLKSELSVVNKGITSLLTIANSNENNSKTFKKLIAIQEQIQSEYEALNKKIQPDLREASRIQLLESASSKIARKIEEAKKACLANYLNPAIDKNSRKEKDKFIKLSCINDVEEIIKDTAKDLAKLEVDIEIYTKKDSKPFNSSEILRSVATNFEKCIEADQEQYIKNRWYNIKQPLESQTLANNKQRREAFFTKAYKEIFQKDPFFSELSKIQGKIATELTRIRSDDSIDPIRRNHIIKALDETQLKIQIKIDNAITDFANNCWLNPETVRSDIKNTCKTAIAKTIKTDLIDNKVLDFSWREKFCRFLYNLVVKIGITPHASNSPNLMEKIYKDKATPAFFRSTTSEEHKAIEEIYKNFDDIKISPQE